MKKLITSAALLALILVGSQAMAQAPQDKPHHQPSTTPLPAAGQGYFALYSKTNGNGDPIVVVPANYSIQTNLKATSGANDVIAGLYVVGGTGMANQRLVLYDNEFSHTDDDYTEIRLKKPIPAGVRVLVGNIQTTYEDQWVQVTYHKVNGLQGKVSSFQIFFSL